MRVQIRIAGKRRSRNVVHIIISTLNSLYPQTKRLPGKPDSIDERSQYAMAMISPPMPLPSMLSTDTITSRALRVTFTVASPPV